MNRVIMFLHPGALGDILLAVPAIRRIDQQHPRHEKLLIARGAVGQFLADCRVIQSWMDLDGQDGGGLFSQSAVLSAKLQAELTRCDVAVVWVEDHDSALASRLGQYGIRQIRIRSPFFLGLRARHQADRFLEIVDQPAAALFTDRLQVPQHLVEQGRFYLERKNIANARPMILLHPGSGSIHKCLNPKVLAGMIKTLEQAGMNPLVIEGPDDHETVEELFKYTDRRPSVLRRLDLSLLAGILVQSTAYIGHDSGVTHLSALLGVRTIAIFGPTDPHRWAPRGSHITIVRGEPCVCETWETVKTCIDKPCLQVKIEKILDVLGLNVGG